MAKNAKAAGTRRERQVMAVLEETGWVCQRAAGSLGAADIIALRRGEGPILIQVKANVGSPYKNFSRRERWALSTVASRSGARPLLCHWPPRGRRQYYNENKWPGG